MTRHRIFLAIPTLAFVASVVTFGRPDDSYQRVGNSLSAFGSVFREISTKYVDEVDAQLLIDAGIDGMLSKLDPYSEFYRDDEREELDQISTGTYTGFGINVVQRDGQLIIAGVREGYPAAKAGVRIGDRLVKVDSVVTDTMSTRSLRYYTRGKSGSIANVKFIRDGRADTLSLQLARTEISVENVAVSEMLDDNIGYIRLLRFSKNADVEVRRAIERLRGKGELQGLVLDLRNNPGGLMEAAIEIVKLFVPEGSLIVSTRGRYAEDNRSYYSNAEPIEPTLPLAVLINGYSASASEIVAGAIQDLDRGIIIGSRSYGKGLVQQMSVLSPTTTIKYTTSRYYTPSGRSIQNIDYVLARNSGSKAVATTKDGNVFHTKNGRDVIELHGIQPDSVVSDSVLPSLAHYVVRGNLLFKYVTTLTSSWDALPENYSTTKSSVETFIKWVETQPTEKKSPALAELSVTRKRAAAEHWPPALVKSIDASFASIDKEISKSLRSNSEAVRVALDNEIRSRFEREQVTSLREVRQDNIVLTARQILQSQKYAGILNGQNSEDQ